MKANRKSFTERSSCRARGGATIEGMMVLMPLMVIMLLALGNFAARRTDNLAAQEAHRKVFFGATPTGISVNLDFGFSGLDMISMEKPENYGLDELPESVVSRTSTQSYRSIFKSREMTVSRKAALLRPSWTLRWSATEGPFEANKVKKWGEALEFERLPVAQEAFHYE